MENKYNAKTLAIVAMVTLIIGAILGIYITKSHWPTLNETVKTVNVPVVTEKINTLTDTKLAYVPGQTVYLPGKDVLVPGALVAPVSKDTPGAVGNKLDGNFDIGKPSFIYQVNGKVGQFNKKDDENFIFDKGMLDLKQSSTVTINAEIPTIDLTRHSVVTVGAMYSDGKTSPAVGYTGSMGRVGAYQLVGSQNGGYAGIGVKF